MAFLTLVDAPLSSESMKFPVFSQLTGNLETESGSVETASSSGESGANRNWPAGTSLSSAEAVQAPSSTGDRGFESTSLRLPETSCSGWRRITPGAAITWTGEPVEVNGLVPRLSPELVYRHARPTSATLSWTSP